jgi:hypothetical protein
VSLHSDRSGIPLLPCLPARAAALPPSCCRAGLASILPDLLSQPGSSAYLRPRQGAKVSCKDLGQRAVVLTVFALRSRPFMAVTGSRSAGRTDVGADGDRPSDTTRRRDRDRASSSA